MKKRLFVSLVLVLFLFSPYAAQSGNEARSQSVKTGASGEAIVRSNGFSTQVFGAVSTDAAGTKAGTVKAGVAGESLQGGEKRQAKPQAPKAPTGLRVIRGN